MFKDFSKTHQPEVPNLKGTTYITYIIKFTNLRPGPFDYTMPKGE